jgi:hypothetical protein
VSAIPLGLVSVIDGAVGLMINAISLVSALQKLILSLTKILQLFEAALGTNQG